MAPANALTMARLIFKTRPKVQSIRFRVTDEEFAAIERAAAEDQKELHRSFSERGLAVEPLGPHEWARRIVLHAAKARASKMRN
jgi:hypothetical protein